MRRFLSLQKNFAKQMQGQRVLNAGRILQGLNDIQGWLSPRINQIYHHSKPLHFRFQYIDGNQAAVTYRENSKRPWKTIPLNLLTSISKGEPEIIIPQHFHSINFSGLRNNIKNTYRDQFSNQPFYKWWMEFSLEMEEIANSPERIKSYAEAVQLLPCLIGKSARQEEKEESVNYEYFARFQF